MTSSIVSSFSSVRGRVEYAIHHHHLREESHRASSGTSAVGESASAAFSMTGPSIALLEHHSHSCTSIQEDWYRLFRFSLHIVS